MGERRYSVTYADGDPVSVAAKSASAARYAIFKALREAGYRIEFRDFLRRVSVLCMGATNA